MGGVLRFSTYRATSVKATARTAMFRMAAVDKIILIDRNLLRNPTEEKFIKVYACSEWAT